MAEYLIQSENLTAIADEIRVLSGTEDTLSPYAMETKLQEANTDVNTESELISQIMTVLNGKADIVIPEIKINTATAKLSSNGTSISFTGLDEEPKIFAISPTGNITLGSTRYVTSVMYDGSTTHGTYGYRSGSSGTSYYSASYFTWTYSDGTLTVNTSSTTNGGYFSSSVTYQLAYVTTTEGSIGGGTNEGLQLPTLSNAGVAADLAAGKQLIDGNGNVVTGTHECESGGVTVQRTTGSFTTNYSGSASVTNLGFKPDLIMFSTGTWHDTPAYSCFAFVETGSTSITDAVSPSNSTNYLMSLATVTQTSSGFSVSLQKIDYSYNQSNETFRTISYTAIKYS